MELIDDIDNLIQDISRISGKSINSEKYNIVDRGVPHQPRSLPTGTMGIYTFYYNNQFLKIGKAGSRSNARFLNQHYNPKSAQSTLAASILNDENMRDEGISETNIGDWIRSNCRRIDIILEKELGIFSLNLIEAALHFKYEPKYEGFVSQKL